jgi:alginate O-acetyltransferase complex protein AlgI
VLFNSLTFVVFFAIVLALHFAPFLSWRTKKVILLLESYLFYAAWNPPFVVLLWLSTAVDWLRDAAGCSSAWPPTSAFSATSSTVSSCWGTGRR